MKKIRIIAVVEFVFILASSLMLGANATDIKPFLNSNIPGLNIQVNATAETLPSQNITVILKLSKLPEVKEVNMEHFNLSIFGFLYGKEKQLIANITGNTLKEYNVTFSVPENIWETMYGEITLTYDVKYEGPFGSLTVNYPDITVGFTMTYVENIYLEQLKQIFHDQLGKDLTPENLNETLLEYKQLKGSQNELGSTRVVIGILVITTVFFAATTLYLILRKPKEYW
ncbi:hypothetical protein CW707_01270 [Candidatus Bathyarchaeota archaeon]|nr:MAG: hypothetical protein CW667_01610 [Candidatus Bathyarchaeota archaeon]RJS82318.1 MAG: hypothetical protein CW707_01270 [Candidatus Bathyarchaeota archaeon]RLI17763.1 MAG: hypothetical protein DRO44_02795 [Candidatus Bathyarchaeota archaeon]